MTTRVERRIERERRRYYRWNNLRAMYAAWRLARDPGATRFVFVIGDAQDNIVESERRLGRINDPFADPALEALWQARFSTLPYDLDALGKLPPDTLGGAYARHMKQGGFRADYYRDEVPRHRMQFLRQRMRQTHDVWHVLTGFGADEFDEVGIQGFYAGQYTSSMAAIIAAGAFLKSILRARFRDLEKHVDAFCEGYIAGKRAKPLLAVKWEELWEEKLETLRRHFAIELPPLRHTAVVHPLRNAA